MRGLILCIKQKATSSLLTSISTETETSTATSTTQVQWLKNAGYIKLCPIRREHKTRNHRRRNTHLQLHLLPPHLRQVHPRNEVLGREGTETTKYDRRNNTGAIDTDGP